MLEIEIREDDDEKEKMMIKWGNEDEKANVILQMNIN